jgi:hypothetical protein
MRVMNMNEKTETIDCTPSWSVAIKMWFTAIRYSVLPENVTKAITDAEAEMIRLAVGFDQANDRIEELEAERDEARERYAAVWWELDGLDVHEFGCDYHDEEDVSEVKRGMFDQIQEWNPTT